jgi:lipoyl(octanoyl) transferase
MQSIEIISLGIADYQSVYEFQNSLFSENIRLKTAGEATQNSLILCQHPHVYTLGKSGAAENLLISDAFLKSIQATYVKTDRGGDITYHGPGQLVGYPIFDLDSFGFGIRDYVQSLENVLIHVLAEYEIQGEISKDAVGVWLDNDLLTARKIAAIGVKVSRGVTMHGFALNVNTNLDYFNYINPCGFTDKGVTSMQKELGKSVDIQEVEQKIAKKFKLYFA